MNNFKYSAVLACRVCLTTQYETKVTMARENGLLKMFEYCFGLQINPDHRSRTLCKPCADDMKKFSKFKEKCLKSDAIWRSNLLLTSELQIKYLKTEETMVVDSESDHERMKEESFYDEFESHTEITKYPDIEVKIVKSEDKKKRKNYPDFKMKTRSRNKSKAPQSQPSTLEEGPTSQSSKLEKGPTSQNNESKVDSRKANDSDDDISFEEFLKKYEANKIARKKKRGVRVKKVFPLNSESQTDLRNTNNSNNDIDFEVFLNENEEDENLKVCENQEMLCYISGKKYSLQKSKDDFPDIIDDVNFEDFMKAYEATKMVREENAVLCKCGRKYYTKSTYSCHIKKCKIFKFYKSEGVILHTNCGLCEFSAQDVDSLRKHLDEHFERNDLDCKLCDFSGRDFAEMIHHRYSHLDKKSRMYCHICRKMIVRPNILLFHFRSVHMKKKGGLCSYCGEEIASYKGWIRHELRVHGRDRYGESQDIYICDCCGLRFLYRGNIIKHFLERDGLKTCVCDTCGAAFKRPSNLKSHIRNIHTDHEMVKCPHCQRSMRKYMLQKHITLIHGEKKFICEVCSAGFTNNRYLKYHMMNHTNERPFQCDFCHTQYKAKVLLKRHITVKHMGMKPYQCKECQKGFGHAGQLRRHVMIVHTKIKPFKCGQCDKSFYCKYSLRRHEEKVHIDIPKYEFEVMLS